MKVRFWHPASGIRLEEIGEGGAVIGRAGGGADIGLEGDYRISRRHGKVWVENNQVWYEDMGSQNGSFVDGDKLQARVALRPGVAVLLSETRLTLDEDATPMRSLSLPEGLEVRMQGRAGHAGLVETLGGDASTYMAAIYEVVERLLRDSSQELIPEALRRMRQVVPAAQRIALVAWPAEPDGSFRNLVPGETTAISSSLARYVVEQRQALLLSDADAPDNVPVGPSVVFHGIRSAVYVPLVTSTEEVLGVLCVDSPSATLPLTPQHFQFICAVGGLLATALLGERLRAVKARREAMLSFLQIASHDLKNPLTAIENAARMFKMVKKPEQHETLVSIISGASKRANDLIHAYLDVSEVESGHALKLELGTVDPHQIVDDELQFLQMALQERLSGITLQNRVACREIVGDDKKLRQIFANLISNAIKYSPAGGEVSVRGEIVGGEVHFSVSDQGVGISPEDQKRLFGAFQRVGDRAVAPGTGLGLWLTAALVEAHGGRIWVESTPGAGSTFSFTAPLRVPVTSG
ncbi:MAG: sensor histidine kinase [Candidatus Xenobia bacterium]